VFRSIAVREKKLYVGNMKQISFLAVIGCSIFLAGCTSKDEFVSCPAISAPEQGTRAYVRSDETRQVFDVRLNGVDAVCTRHKSGGTKIALRTGLKVKRDLAAGAGNDTLSLPLMTAIVDRNQAVTANEDFGYLIGFSKDDAVKYPVVEFEQIVPADARLVISLKPAY
jgi:hypothetical protein